MRIYLTTEGTYPYVLGGVSTWTDMLVRRLQHHYFEVGAVVDNPFHRLAFSSPENVRIHPIPLWGLELPEEFQRQPGAWRRSWRTSSRLVHSEFVPSWQRFLDAITTANADTGDLADALRAIAHFAENYDLRKALSHAGTWDELASRLHGNPIHARSGLAPTMLFARTLYRYLMPLAVPTSPCDIAHTTAAGLCALPAIMSKYRYGAPLVLTEHGVYLRERLLALSHEPIGTKLLFTNFYRAVVELCYQEANVVAPVCAYNATWEQVLGVAPERIRVIHNGVEAETHVPVREPSGPPTIGFVGRIDPLKDVVTLIRAFARLRGRRPDARLRLWGPATSEEYLLHCRSISAQLGVTDAVTFEGPTTVPARAYAACHVVVLSSISEAFPYTVIEAMLAARPVVATAVGGVSEAVGEADCAGTGLLVEPGNPGAMAHAVDAVLGASVSERAKVGRRLRQRALGMFTAERFAGRYDALYRELAGDQETEPAVAEPRPAHELARLAS
ncbi:MAG: GT4 family glycosyltransferase PelF [Acidimicrobiales bacterium]|nr:GT4 family glycosyltransferase PelF [Acidimicrobiales bacterium]